jgi:hypothetical protein
VPQQPVGERCRMRRRRDSTKERMAGIRRNDTARPFVAVQGKRVAAELVDPERVLETHLQLLAREPHSERFVAHGACAATSVR